MHCGPFDNFYPFRAYMKNLIVIGKLHTHFMKKVTTLYAILIKFISSILCCIFPIWFSRKISLPYMHLFTKKGEISTKPTGLSRGETMPLLFWFRMKWNNSKGRPRSYTLLILLKFNIILWTSYNDNGTILKQTPFGWYIGPPLLHRL